MNKTELHSLLKGIGTADIVDAMSKTYSHRAHIIGLVAADPNKTLFGQAVTVGFLPVRKDLMDQERHSLGPAIYRALDGANPSGRVLVMSSGGHSDLSLGGGTKLSRIDNLGMAGVLCDGRLRDLDDLAGYKGAFYCTGETTRAGGNMIQPYLTNVPVIVGGVTVAPGDYIFADKTGAVVIPAGDVEKTLKMAHEILQMATGMLEMIKHEDPAQVLGAGSKEA